MYQAGYDYSIYNMNCYSTEAKKSLKILKWYSESKKYKRTNNDLQSIHIKID